MRSSPGWRKLFRVLVFYVALIAAWHLLALATGWTGPGDVAVALWRTTRSGHLGRGLGATVLRMAVGYTLSIALGLSLGVFTGSVRWADETIGTLVLGLQSLPSVTWFPLAVLWFGANEGAVVFVVLMGSVWSIAVSARAGVQNIPPLQLRAARMFGGSVWQRYTLVVIPAMVPSIVQGLKLGWSFAWRSLLAAELLFGSASLGNLLNAGRKANDTGLVMAVFVVIIIVGVAMDRLVFARMEGWVAERWGTAT